MKNEIHNNKHRYSFQIEREQEDGNAWTAALGVFIAFGLPILVAVFIMLVAADCFHHVTMTWVD